MILAIRVDRDKKTNEIKRVKVVDMDDYSVDIISHSILKKILKDIPNCIANMYLDNNGRLRLREMSPYKNNKAYNTITTPLYKIQQFCFITDYNKGVISWVADTTSIANNYGVDFTAGSTIDRLIELLNIPSIKDLKIYNGYLNDKSLFIFTDYKNNEPSFRLCGNLITTTNDKTNAFNNSWEVEYIDDVTIKYMENEEGKHEYTIPEGIKSLIEFGGGVNKLTLPNSLVHLDSGCFSGLDDLYTLKFGDKITTIPEDCFNGSALESVTFGASITDIERSAFEDCDRIRGLLVVNAHNIGSKAFSGIGASKILLLDAVDIGTGSFSYNFKLTEVKFGDDLRVIRAGAFKNCDRLEKVNIPDNCKYIGKQAFSGTKLRTVNIPRHTKVCEGAFPKRCKVVYRD